MFLPLWVALWAHLICYVTAQEPNATFTSATIQNLLNRNTDIDSTTKASWCNLQTSLCNTLCNNVGPLNTCDSTTLDWQCHCANGSTPGLQYYPFSMTGIECQILYDDCTQDNIPAGAIQKDCKSLFTCGLATKQNAIDAANAGAAADAAASSASASAASASASAASASAASASAASASAASASAASLSTASTTPSQTNSPTGVAAGASESAASSPASGRPARSGSLSGGAIAGIVIGAAAGGAAILAVFGFLCWKRHGRSGTRRDTERQGRAYGTPMSLSPDNLDKHLASNEWAGLRQGVPQKQTAFHHQQYEQQQQERGLDHDGLSGMSDLRPEDALGEPRYADDSATGVYSAAAHTALHPASETVYHPRV